MPETIPTCEVILPEFLVDGTGADPGLQFRPAGRLPQPARLPIQFLGGSMRGRPALLQPDQQLFHPIPAAL